MSYLHGTKEAAKAAAPETIAIPDSSFLQSATYDSVNFSLTLDFKNGSQIVHRFVYPMTWQKFKESPSKGSFYTREIKGKSPIVMRSPLKVSDLKKAIREKRPNATNFNKARAR